VKALRRGYATAPMTSMRSSITPLLASLAIVAAGCSDAPAPKPPAPLVVPGSGAPVTTASPTASTPAAVGESNVDPSRWKVSSSADDPQWLEVAGFRAPKPASWVWTKPSMQFRTLQYTVPGDADSTKQADLIVSVFVAGDGGPLDANIERWRGQFRKNNEPVEAKRSSREVGPLKVEFVELEGDFMAMGAPAAKTGTLQLAAIVQAEGRNVFFRLVGPKETVEANREAFDKMIDGLMPAD
jgi:hypothetical protein